MTKSPEGSPPGELPSHGDGDQFAWGDNRSGPVRLGQYEVHERIGRGGMGAVYRALHVSLKRWVALKVLPHERSDDPAAVARFQREMEAVGRLDHPNVVRATDAGVAGSVHFLVMELIDGMDLGRLVRRRGPLPVADACELMRQAAIGLQCIDDNGLVHRDLKPSNLLLSRKGQLKILDLGLARLGGNRPSEDHLTATGQAMGTADFMAPEQWEAGHTVDIRADLYSLGCTLYALLTGRPPFGGPEYDSVYKKMTAHTRVAVPPIRPVRPEVPDRLVDVLRRLLAKDPVDRFAVPAEVAEQLVPLCFGAQLADLVARSESVGEAGPAVERLTRNDGETSEGLEQVGVSPPGRRPVALRRLSPPSSSTPAVPAPAPPFVPRRVYRWPQYAVAAALAIGLVAGWTAWRSPADKVLPQSEPAPLPLPVAFSPLDWPHPPERARWEFQADKSELALTAVGEIFLRFGNDLRDDFRFEVGIEPMIGQPGSSLGVFLGYHESNNDGSTVRRCQVIELVTAAFDDHRLMRRVRTFRSAAGPSSCEDLAEERVARPFGREHRLEIAVRQGVLQRVRWNGGDLPGLADPPARPQPRWPVPGDDYRGAVGVCGNQATIVFRSPRISLDHHGNEDH